MNLSQLPDALIAQIAEQLDYSDICNFMETNTRNYNSLKKYQKDKIKLHTLYLHNFHGVTTMRVSEHISQNEYLFKHWEERKENVDKVKEVLDECSSIDELHVQGDRQFNSKTFNALMNTSTKIGTLYIYWDEFTMEEKLKLCEKLNVLFTYIDVNTDSDYPDVTFFNDKFLNKILPGSTIRNWASKVIGSINTPMPLTDLTLNALIDGNKVQKTFRIEKVRNSITIKGLAEILNEKNDIDHLYWHLGILQPHQAADAERYFGENGEMRSFCDIRTNQSRTEDDYKVSKFELLFHNGSCQIDFDLAIF